MTRPLRSFVVAAFCSVLLPALGAAADLPKPGAAEREVRELERKFEQAVIKGDIAFFDRVLAKDFTHTTQSGKFRDRQEWLANHKAGQSNYDALNVDQLAVHAYGDTAVVTAAIKPQGRDSQGKPMEGRYRYLRVWVRRDGTWQVVAFQSTRIADTKKAANP
jgi:ketosteroid isomerase-like protein